MLYFNKEYFNKIYLNIIEKSNVPAPFIFILPVENNEIV